MSLIASPSAWPAGWPEPNYENPVTRGNPALFVVTFVLTTIVVALRLYCRWFVVRSIGLDDTLVVAGFILSIGQTMASYKALSTWGWNMHLWDIPPHRLKYVRLSAWLIEFFFLLGTACTKISILLVYRKISSGSRSLWFIRLTWAAIGFTIIYTASLALELMLVCRPLPAYWNSYSPSYAGKYKCGNERAPIVFSAAASVVSDIYSSVLPMLLTARLALTVRQRVGLYTLFSAGLLTAGVGCARLYFLLKVTMNYLPGPNTHDVTWEGWPTFALTDIEAKLAIICASVPALKVLFKRRISHQLSNIQASVRSASFRRMSSRKHYTLEAELTNHVDSRWDTPVAAASVKGFGAHQRRFDEEDEEDALESLNNDKPLGFRRVCVPEVQRLDSQA